MNSRLIIAGVLVVTAACGPSRVSPPTKPAGISQEEAARLAIAEADRRGNKGAKLGYCRAQEGHWIVGLVGPDPAEIGSHSWVEVSTNGQILRYQGGM